MSKGAPRSKGTLRAPNMPDLESTLSLSNWAMVGNDVCSQGQVFFVYYMGRAKD